MNDKLATQLRSKADCLQEKIDVKLDPAISHQNLTARRARIAGNMREDVYLLQKVQAVLRGLAELWERCPSTIEMSHCSAVRSNTLVLDLLSPWTRIGSHRLTKAGIATQEELDKARAFVTALAESKGPTYAERELRTKEEALIGRKIPGFFPTPEPLVTRMLDILDESLQLWHGSRSPASRLKGRRVLEPSAGKGDIAEALRSRYPDSDLHVVEINWELSSILALRGFPKIVTEDFLTQVPRAELLADAIVQNPPFEEKADIDHVYHAYSWLAPGGTLVSVVSAGTFSRQDQKTSDFRDWLSRLDHDIHDVDGPAFKASFRSTSVNTSIVRITKPWR